MAVTPVVYDDAAGRYRPWAEATDPPVGGAAPYIHYQTALSDAWVVSHSLGSKALDIAVFDPYGVRLYTDADWASATTHVIVIRFAAPYSGKAYVRKLD
jgi:hypothetical protein